MDSMESNDKQVHGKHDENQHIVCSDYQIMEKKNGFMKAKLTNKALMTVKNKNKPESWHFESRLDNIISYMDQPHQASNSDPKASAFGTPEGRQIRLEILQTRREARQQ